ncbi:hypothetical protein [Actinomadura sp. 9N407]|uniref:hypothetical protein n=1 Tax=Actinomadura sp. 9N407 TaxID=3375154 RepID=UPI0037B5C878
MDTRTRSDDQELIRLRTEFTGHRIWRSVRSDGRLGEWVASLHDPEAGITPTLMFPTPEQLREALVQERLRAAVRLNRTW